MKKENVILTTTKYSGEYVALKSFKDTTVVAHGKIPEKVAEKAFSKGYSNAVMLFVPEKNVRYIY